MKSTVGWEPRSDIYIDTTLKMTPWKVNKVELSMA